MRIADLGCGPGALTVPLSAHVGEIVAVDPSTDMLAVATRAAADGCRSNIVFLYGRAEDWEQLDAGPIQHVLFGRSFHWTDRTYILATLDRMLPQSGAVAPVRTVRKNRSTW